MFDLSGQRPVLKLREAQQAVKHTCTTTNAIPFVELMNVSTRNHFDTRGPRITWPASAPGWNELSRAHSSADEQKPTRDWKPFNHCAMRARNHLDGAVTRLSPYIRHGVLTLRAVRPMPFKAAATPSDLKSSFKNSRGVTTGNASIEPPRLDLAQY